MSLDMAALPPVLIVSGNVSGASPVRKRYAELIAHCVPRMMGS
jgi:hypothetical protein